MGKKDTVTKDYIRNTKVFADAFNYFLYGGEQVIDSEKLHEMDTTAIGMPHNKMEAGIPIQKYRDGFKYLAAMSDDQNAYLILGMELQSNTHYAMPVKVNLYDALEYAKQVEVIANKHREEMKAQKKKDSISEKGEAEGERYHPTSDEYLGGFWEEDTLVPVITLVVIFSSEKWEGPLSLHEMFSIQDEKILSYVPNYRINFISPATMSEEEIDKLHSSLREVMLYIKHSKDKEKLTAMVREDERFKNLDRKAAEVINAVTNTRMMFDDDEDDKEECDMCKAIDDLCEEIRENTTLESIKKVMRSLDVSVEKAMDILEISEEDCGKYRSRIQEQRFKLKKD